jgi:hypothetical protein
LDERRIWMLKKTETPGIGTPRALAYVAALRTEIKNQFPGCGGR